MEELDGSMGEVSTAKFGSDSDLAKLIGVSQPHVTQLSNMLNLPPAEIEAIRFEAQ